LEYDSTVRNVSISGAGSGTPGTLGAFVAWPFRPLFGVERTQILRRANFRVMENEACQRAIAETNLTLDTTREFCTTSESGQLTGDVSACDGNIGSPLFVGSDGNQEVLGILIRYNTPCNARDRPTGIFVRLSEYIQWINAIVAQP
jgi:secreted trypsin-like serine protease